MEYRVAIQFFKEIADAFKCIGNYKGSDVDRKTLAIIDLLEQGEKYKQMWEEVKKYYGNGYYYFDDEEGHHVTFVHRMMTGFEKKYFPKPTEDKSPIDRVKEVICKAGFTSEEIVKRLTP